MKIIPTSYTFSAATKEITSLDFSSIEKLAIITNLTKGVIIYQFNNPLKGGTLTGNTLSLTYDTTTHADTDDLQIIIHDTTPLATEQTLQEIVTKQSEIIDKLIAQNEITPFLRNLLTEIALPRNADTTNNSDRVTIVAGGISLNANQTLAVLTNLQQLNGVQAHQISVATEIEQWYVGPRSRIV